MILRLVAECEHGHRLADMDLDPDKLVYLPVLEEHQEGDATVTHYGPPNTDLGHRLQVLMAHFSAVGRILERHGCPTCQRGKQLRLNFEEDRCAPAQSS